MCYYNYAELPAEQRLFGPTEGPKPGGKPASCEHRTLISTRTNGPRAPRPAYVPYTPIPRDAADPPRYTRTIIGEGVTEMHS